MKKFAFLFVLSLAACVSPSHRDTNQPFSVVSDFDAQKYLGKWYQLANYPQWFDRGCMGTTAEYAPISETEIQVVNTCYQGSFENTPTISKGKARIDKPGVLTVTFFGDYPANPNYYVMAIKEDYEMAVVGTPDGKTGWILARQAQVSEANFNWGVTILKNAGYDISALDITKQKPE